MRRDAAYRRILFRALLFSAVVHLAAVLLYPRLFGRLPEARLSASASATAPPEGMEVINLVEVTSPLETPREPEREPELEPESLPAPPAPPTAQVEREAPAAVTPERPPEEPGGLSAAQRLQPRTSDPRLWVPLSHEITDLSFQQKAENLLYAQLEVLNDSARARAERAADAMDWTFTDKDGNKWGVSPGKLHLGPVTLPLPFVFGLPPGATDDLWRAQAQDAEIRRAAGQAGIDETAKERAEAIRRRIDEERRRRAPPDTGRASGGGGG